jgi:parallel beta-helix repeat protein
VTCRSAACTCPASKPCTFSTHVVRQLRPGDTLFFGAGTFRGHLFADLEGTPLTPITLRGTKAVDGAGLLTTFEARNRERDTLEVRGSSYLVIRDFNITGASRAGIRLNNSHYITVENNRFETNGVWGIFTNHSNNSRLLNNTIIGPAKQHGIYLSNSGDVSLIAGNFIANFDACGIHVNGDKSMGGARNVVGDGVIEDVVIRNNYIVGNGAVGGSAINIDGGRNTLIRSNILVGNKSASIALFRGNGGIPTANTRILDNLIVGAPESRGLLIYANGASGGVVMGNTIVGRNARAPLVSIEGTAERSLMERLRGHYEIPADFVGNRYAHLGPVATYGENDVLEDFDAWVSAAADAASRLLEIDRSLLAAPDPSALYRRLYEQLRSATPLTANPHLDRLLESTAY